MLEATEKEKKPRIMILGENGMEEIDYDELPDADAAELMDYFKPVRISPRALDQASKIIPPEYFLKHGGLHKLLQMRADSVFSKLSCSQREGFYGKLKYIFEFDADGPVLKTVSL